MAATDILVLGGAHIDRRGRISGVTRPGASNPGVWFEEAGGGAFNAARNLARLGHRVALVSPRGGDAEADKVSVAALAAGVIDRPFTFLDRRTPSYTAILEQDGNLVIALADMDLYTVFTPRRLATRALRDRLDAAGLVLTDANLPEETLVALALACRARAVPLAAIAISPAKAIRLKPVLGDLACLFMNEAEAAVLAEMRPPTAGGWTEALRAAGLAAAVVTRGRLGALAYDDAATVTLQPEPVETLGDVTGAGDAMAAGFLDALLGGLDASACLKRGTALAGLTVRSPFVVVEPLDRAILDAECRLVPDGGSLA